MNIIKKDQLNALISTVVAVGIYTYILYIIKHNPDKAAKIRSNILKIISPFYTPKTKEQIKETTKQKKKKSLIRKIL